MSNKYFPLLILLLVCCAIVPVHATLINITVLFNNRPTTDVQPTRIMINDVTQYISTVSGKSITLETLFLPTGETGQTIYFTLKRNTNSITGTIKKESISIFSGQIIFGFDGGTTRSIQYARVPGISGDFFDFCPSITIAYAQQNTTSNYYLMAVPTMELTGFSNSINSLTSVLYTGDLDTTDDAYIQLSNKLSTNPIYQISFQSSNAQTFSLDYWYESIHSTRQNEIAVSSGKLPIGQDPDAVQISIFSSILSVIISLIEFSKDIASYIIFVGAIAAFVLGAQVFLTLIAAYTILNAVLSIHDSDSLFGSIGKFMKREMKLFRFFMEIINWVMKLIFPKG